MKVYYGGMPPFPGTTHSDWQPLLLLIALLRCHELTDFPTFHLSAMP